MSWRLTSPKFLKASYSLNSHCLDTSGYGHDGTWATGTEAYRSNAYGKQMGDFDGADSLFTVTDNSITADLFDNGASVSALIIADSDGEGDQGRIFQRDSEYNLRVVSEASGKVKIAFTHYFSDTNGGWASTATCVNIGEPTLVTFVYDRGAVGNDPIIYVNDKMPALTEDTTPVGTASSYAADFTIGGNSGLSRIFDGGIGSVKLFKGMEMTYDEHLALYRMVKRGL